MNIRGIELSITDTGSGTPFLWCHGMTGSQALDDETGPIDWVRVGCSNRVVRWDSRGHGQSGYTRQAIEFAWSNLACDILEIADKMGITQFTLGGASMGCGAAIHTAVQAPERIKGLVLMIPPTAWETRQPIREAYPLAADLLEQKGLAALLDSRIPPTTFWGIHTDVIYQRHLKTLDPQALALIHRGASLSDLPPRQAVAVIHEPTLILAMDDDPGHPLSTAQILHELIAGSRLKVACSVEDMLTWTDQVIDFLKTIGEDS
jgi:3-oxoadipate enol-lactonase